MNTRVQAITLKQLRALSSVAETGSLTATATTFGLTAPAIHNQLKLLEENLGCPLVLRGGGVPARLTAEGRILTGSFAAMERTLEGALRQIHARRSGLAGSVVLGVVSTAKYFAPALVARIQTAYRDIEMVLKVGNRDEIIAMLGHGLVDLVIMGRPPREPQVEARVIGVHPLVIIAPPGHRFAAAEDLTPEELLQETFIAREPGSGTRILMIRYLDRIGEGLPYRFIEMGSNETIKQAVIAGLGIALISQHTVTSELCTGQLVTVPFPGLPIRRYWHLLHRADKPPAQAAATVHRFILDQNGGFLPDLQDGAAPV